MRCYFPLPLPFTFRPFGRLKAGKLRACPELYTAYQLDTRASGRLAILMVMTSVFETGSRRVRSVWLDLRLPQGVRRNRETSLRRTPGC